MGVCASYRTAPRMAPSRHHVAKRSIDDDDQVFPTKASKRNQLPLAALTGLPTAYRVGPATACRSWARCGSPSPLHKIGSAHLRLSDDRVIHTPTVAPLTPG